MWRRPGKWCWFRTDLFLNAFWKTKKKIMLCAHNNNNNFNGVLLLNWCYLTLGIDGSQLYSNLKGLIWWSSLVLKFATNDLENSLTLLTCSTSRFEKEIWEDIPWRSNFEWAIFLQQIKSFRRFLHQLLPPGLTEAGPDPPPLGGAEFGGAGTEVLLVSAIGFTVASIGSHWK